jgi:DUF4097 and DUF4098 domain-containing protein YvlB
MNKLFLILVVSILSVTNTAAQKGPLRGSGKVVTRTFDYKGFDKVSFEDFNGKIEVEIGKPFAITVEIDDNLEPMLRVEKEDAENQLRISLANNKDGRLYLEDVNIKITVSMPEASVISHAGNSDVKIQGIVGRYFRLEHRGNGNILLEGQIDELDVNKSGNGDVNAKKLYSKVAKVNSQGNGDVTINATVSLYAKGEGNGDILQVGQGSLDALSSIKGNGKLRKM